MSAIPDQLRQQATERAQYRCEYCRIPQRGQVATFPVDHIIPRTSGGLTILENLALACPNCNAHKWAHATGVDPLSKDVIPLFNPRIQTWAEHFRWSLKDFAHIEGLTPIGRATIDRLQMNHPDLVFARQLLAAVRVPLG